MCSAGGRISQPCKHIVLSISLLQSCCNHAAISAILPSISNSKRCSVGVLCARSKIFLSDCCVTFQTVFLQRYRELDTYSCQLCVPIPVLIDNIRERTSRTDEEVRAQTRRVQLTRVKYSCQCTCGKWKSSVPPNISYFLLWLLQHCGLLLFSWPLQLF